MSGAWTPGPWAVVETPKPQKIGAFWYEVVADGCNPNKNPDEDAIAEVFASPIKANAHLIAAAPDMYAALDMVDAMFSNPGQINKTTVREVVRAALAKARGEAK